VLVYVTLNQLFAYADDEDDNTNALRSNNNVSSQKLAMRLIDK